MKGNSGKIMSPILTITDQFVTSSLAYVGQLFTDLNLLIVLAIGLPVGFWVINRAIGLVTGHVGRGGGRRGM